jgi:hypothetical protein
LANLPSKKANPNQVGFLVDLCTGFVDKWALGVDYCGDYMMAENGLINELSTTYPQVAT